MISNEAFERFIAYRKRCRQLGVRFERGPALGCKGFGRYCVRCNNQTTNEPPYCRAHIEQAPGGKLSIYPRRAKQ